MNGQPTEKDKMLAGELYLAGDPELAAERQRAKRLCHRYNQSLERDAAALEALLGYPTDAHLEPPFYCDYGYNLRLGTGVYANHNLVILDCAPVTLGDSVFIAPNVVIATAGHPLDPEVRASGLEFARPIRIGDRVWLGANVTVLPGVEIGDGVTVGAGSVVSRSLSPNCVAVGNPCRVIRQLQRPGPDAAPAR